MNTYWKRSRIMQIIDLVLLQIINSLSMNSTAKLDSDVLFLIKREKQPNRGSKNVNIERRNVYSILMCVYMGVLVYVSIEKLFQWRLAVSFSIVDWKVNTLQFSQSVSKSLVLIRCVHANFWLKLTVFIAPFIYMQCDRESNKMRQWGARKMPRVHYPW